MFRWQLVQADCTLLLHDNLHCLQCHAVMVASSICLTVCVFCLVLQKRLFDDNEITQIEALSMKNIMERVMLASWFVNNPDLLQNDVFHYNGISDEIHPNLVANGCAPANAYNNDTLQRYAEPCSTMQTFDYFTGSEGPYIGTMVSLVLYLLLNIVILAVAVRWVKYSAIKAKQAGATSGGAEVWLKAGVFSTAGGVPMVADELYVGSLALLLAFFVWYTFE